MYTFSTLFTASRTASMAETRFEVTTTSGSVLAATIGAVKSLPGGKLLPTYTNVFVFVEPPAKVVVELVTSRFRSFTSFTLVIGLPGGSVQTSDRRSG